ncbi:MAG TPA: type II secretion system protein [Terrimicrobiaceae bacterium]|nr:type II secretion system protein [Terrimicrobiaceae bacterium]
MVQTRSAFSLIEILVVVAMVAMLATVGVSSWRGMQEKSLLARGLNQVRQMGLATCQYAADNDGTLPGSAHDGNSWVAGLLPYFGLSVSSSVDEIKKVSKRLPQVLSQPVAQ